MIDDENDDDENLDISSEPTEDGSEHSFEADTLEMQNPADNDRLDTSFEATEDDSEYSFEDDGLQMQNPADSDGLEDDIEQNTRADETEPFAAPDSMPDTNRLHAAEASSKAERRENKAPFLARQFIVLVALGGIIFIILLVVFIFPLFASDKTENDALDKRGTVYIPNQIEKWSPEVAIENLADSFPEQKEAPPEIFQTDDEILAGIPFSDEALGVAPIEPTANVVPSLNVAPSRPETNRSEQQKMIERMPMTDNALNLNASSQGGAFSQGMASSPYTSVESYAQEATNRMNNLLGSVSNISSGTNSYDPQSDQNNKQAFNNANIGEVGMQMNSEYSLYSGTIIPAALVTGINTDLPGVVIARVTSNVYSSLDGRHLLIPVGTRLFAVYNNSVSYGQNRVQVAWNKMIRPDGLEVNLGNMTGVDDKGVSGYKGFTNNHPFEYAKALGLIAMFSFVDTKVDNLVAAQDNLYAQNIIADTYSNINELSGKIIDRALDIQPTITIAQGKVINIITNVTMDLPPVENFEVTERYIRQ